MNQREVGNSDISFPYVLKISTFKGELRPSGNRIIL